MYDIVEPTGQRILVIDDNESIHADFRAILTPGPGKDVDLAREKAALFGDDVSTSTADMSFEVDCALQGQEGVDKVRRALRENRPYAVAFVDVRMPPGMDGIETIKEIWRQCPNIEIVICTAYSDYSWHDMIAELGQTDKLLILKKPFDNIEVQQLAASLTFKWQLMNRLDQMVKQRTQEIYFWLRQMNCLNKVSSLVEPPDAKWEVTIPAIINLIPSALRYPKQASIKLTLNRRTFHAGHPGSIDWKHCQEVNFRDTIVGTLDVGYSRQQDGPEREFLDEEAELIRKIADKIAYALEYYPTLLTENEYELELKA